MSWNDRCERRVVSRMKSLILLAMSLTIVNVNPSTTDDKGLPAYMKSSWLTVATAERPVSESELNRQITDELRLLFYPIDNIRIMVIFWKLRGNIIRTALCWIVWHNVHSQQHTYMSSSYCKDIQITPLHVKKPRLIAQSIMARSCSVMSLMR